jgi:hypothetical protein
MSLNNTTWSATVRRHKNDDDDDDHKNSKNSKNSKNNSWTLTTSAICVTAN